MLDLIKNIPFHKMKNPSSRVNNKLGGGGIKRRKGVEVHPIVVGVEARAEECGETPHKRELYAQGRKS